MATPTDVARRAPSASPPPWSGGPAEVLAPTRLEYLAVRALRPGFPVVHTGVGLARRGCSPGAPAAIVCGLAGGLAPSLTPGTVVIPNAVATPAGQERACDVVLVRALIDAARTLGLPVVTGPMLTAPRLVTGSERAAWAERGFVAADMETALLPAEVPAATVRVVLDAVARPISERWATPGAALVRPALLRELAWLGWAAPRYALRAARVLRAALARLD